jgi:hypothetical protein
LMRRDFDRGANTLNKRIAGVRRMRGAVVSILALATLSWASATQPDYEGATALEEGSGTQPSGRRGDSRVTSPDSCRHQIASCRQIIVPAEGGEGERHDDSRSSAV